MNLVEALLKFIMVVAGIVEMRQNGDAATDAVLFGVSVDDEVLAALPIDHHERAVWLAEERIHSTRDAVLWQRDYLLRIEELQTTLLHLLLMEFQEHLELFKVLTMGFSFQEIFNLLMHLSATLGRFEHLAYHLLSTLPRIRHISLNVSLFVKIGKELLDERGHGSVVGSTGSIAFVGVGMSRFVEDDFRMVQIGMG